MIIHNWQSKGRTVVQVKRYVETKVSAADVQKTIAGKTLHNARHAMIVTTAYSDNRGFTRDALAQGKKAGVEIIGREELTAKIAWIAEKQGKDKLQSLT